MERYAYSLRVYSVVYYIWFCLIIYILLDCTDVLIEGLNNDCTDMPVKYNLLIRIWYVYGRT
jgi:hypothetical protein